MHHLMNPNRREEKETRIKQLKVEQNSKYQQNKISVDIVQNTSVIRDSTKVAFVKDIPHTVSNSNINLQMITTNSFNYILHPGDVCDSDTSFFVYVYSHPAHHQNRELIRATWGNLTLYHPIKISLLFFGGLSNETTINKAIEVEGKKFQDIVQSSFLDTYRNLTYKAISAMKYITENCETVKYIIKTDDDIFINMFSAIELLQRRIQMYLYKRKELICYFHIHAVAARERDSKWYVSEEEWPLLEYPKYCSGASYIFTPDFALSVLKLSNIIKYFWLEDVYITGILQSLMHVHQIDIKSSFWFNELVTLYESDERFLTQWIFSHGVTYSKWKKLWQVNLKYVNKIR